MSAPRIPSVSLETWGPDGPDAIRGARLRCGRVSVFIAGHHLSHVAGQLATLAAELRKDRDPDGSHPRPAEWRLLARKRENRIRALEAQLSNVSTTPTTASAPAEQSTRKELA